MNICIDFDGTCVTHDFPDVGSDIGAVPVLKKLIENGHNLILFTMRSNRLKLRNTGDDKIHDVIGNFLDDAVNWFKINDIPLYGINTNPEQNKWTTSPKAYADLYIDDSGLGIPLTYNEKLSDRPFVNWKKIEKLLTIYKIIK